MQDSLRLFGTDSGRTISQVSATSNIGLMDARPADPGVAIWFLWDEQVRCIAVDRYQTVHENLQAIHHVLEARRTELRHAGIEITRAAFRGHIAALPAPGAADWWAILGVSRDATVDQISAAYKARARELGANGNDAARAELNVARDKAIKERG